MLKMTRLAWLILAWGIVILTIVDGTYAVRIHSYSMNEYPHYNNKNNNNQESLNGPILTIIVHGFDAAESFIDRHEKLFIVLSTIAIAWFTGTLWRATTGLQDAAERQISDMQESLRIATLAAKAATKSAEIADKSLSIAQRAFVFGKGMNSATHFWEDKIKEYVFWIEWGNVGITPAIQVESWINHKTISITEDVVPIFVKDTQGGSSAVLGPKGIGMSAYRVIPLTDMMELWQKRKKIYIWARVEYRDIFDPTFVHHHEQCLRIGLLHEPSVAPPENHPSYVQFQVEGPQNSTG